MNGTLLILFIVVVSAAYLGTLIAQDPGYVLITYGLYSMQTSLWVMLGLMLAAILIFYLGLKLIGVISSIPEDYIDRRAHKKILRAIDLMNKGHKLLLEGEHKRARKFLDSVSSNSELRAISNLAAARAADRIGDDEARESYLREALEADGSLARARYVLASELALGRGEPELALELLNEATPNDYILEVKMKAIQAISSWSERLSALRRVKKANPIIALAIEKESAALGFSDGSLSDKDRHDLYRDLSPELKRDPAYIAQYIRGLNDKDVVEPLLRSSIKKLWNRELIILYGELGESSLKIRMKTAKNWLNSNRDDPALHYCLGRIYEQSGEKTLAKESYARSIEADGPVDAAVRLGQFMAIEGQYERSVALYQSVIEQPTS